MDLVAEHSSCIKVGGGLAPLLDENLAIPGAPLSAMVSLVIACEGPTFHEVYSNFALVAGNLAR